DHHLWKGVVMAFVRTSDARLRALLVPRTVAPAGIEDTGQLARESDRGDVAAAPAGDSRRPELQRQGCGGLTTDLQRPGCLSEHPSHRRRPRLGDAQALLSLGARALAGDEPQVGLDLVRRVEPRDLVDRRHEADRARWTDAWHRHQPLAELVLRH